MSKYLTVIDFFSGAGGFSEGFRQQGFQIIKGVDFWQPAVDTHNLNHNLSDTPVNILDYWGNDSGDVVKINELPNPNVIIGSPCCTSFSMSNKCGKADKAKGIKLIEVYLRIIAVKKNQKQSKLKAWLMENVPNSRKYIKEIYIFSDLNLSNWAKNNNLSPNAIALTLNPTVLNALDYGIPQNRKRLICGESLRDGLLPIPTKIASKYTSIKDIKNEMPKPNAKRKIKFSIDLNYPHLKVLTKEITDHFYDTGLYKIEWEKAQYLKTMHPYMGKMHFPENEDKPSRTITATKSLGAREALIYKSELERTGNGEFRTPTIREIATMMGYPYTYQFYGSESTKWRLIGNSVSPKLSSALAKAILQKEGLSITENQDIDFEYSKNLHKHVRNLNNPVPKNFKAQKHRKKGARFRRSVYKGSNMTIDWLNYLPLTADKEVNGHWYIYLFYGTGEGYEYDYIDKNKFIYIKKAVKNLPNFRKFQDGLNKILGKSLRAKELQIYYEKDSDIKEEFNPLHIIHNIDKLHHKILRKDLPNISIQKFNRPKYSIHQLGYMYAYSFLVFDLMTTQG